MNGILRTCGMIALAACAIGVSWSEVEAGGRRRACYSQPTYYAPATTAWTPAPAYWAPAPVVANSTTFDGRQRYRSGYQSPAAAPAPVYAAPVGQYDRSEPYYGDRASQPDRPVHFQDRSFEDQNRADRKIRGL